jgi:hypothetical protein
LRASALVRLTPTFPPVVGVYVLFVRPPPFAHAHAQRGPRVLFFCIILLSTPRRLRCSTNRPLGARLCTVRGPLHPPPSLPRSLEKIWFMCVCVRVAPPSSSPWLSPTLPFLQNNQPTHTLLCVAPPFLLAAPPCFCDCQKGTATASPQHPPPFQGSPMRTKGGGGGRRRWHRGVWVCALGSLGLKRPPLPPSIYQTFKTTRAV